MITLRVLLHVVAQRNYQLHSLDFSTAFLQGGLHETIWLRHPEGFTRSFPKGTQWSLQRPVYDLRLAPHEWHDTLRTTLAALVFAPSTADPSPFLRTDTTLLAFYILLYINDLVFATADTEALARVNSKLQKRHTCTDLGPSALWLHLHLTSLCHCPVDSSLVFFVENVGRWSPDREPEGIARHKRTVEAPVTTGPPVGSGGETGTGAASGVIVVQSQKKQRDAPESTQRDYELHSLDFSTAFLEGSLHKEIWLHHPPGFTGSFPVGTQWSLRRPVYGLRQAPREWHDTLSTTLAALGFAPSSADPSLFLRTDTTLSPFYVLV
ncbi:unnamed protein product [Closterium sp. NIES-53]